MEDNLIARKMVAIKVLSVLQNEVDDSDPRKKDAIEHYQKQLQEIEQKIAQRKISAETKPNDVVIGLASARMRAIKT